MREELEQKLYELKMDLNALTCEISKDDYPDELQYQLQLKKLILNEIEDVYNEYLININQSDITCYHPVFYFIKNTGNNVLKCKCLRCGRISDEAGINVRYKLIYNKNYNDVKEEYDKICLVKNEVVANKKILKKYC